jgi:hypothetical protein
MVLTAIYLLAGRASSLFFLVYAEYSLTQATEHHKMKTTVQMAAIPCGLGKNDRRSLMTAHHERGRFDRTGNFIYSSDRLPPSSAFEEPVGMSFKAGSKYLAIKCFITVSWDCRRVRNSDCLQTPFELESRVELKSRSILSNAGVATTALWRSPFHNALARAAASSIAMFAPCPIFGVT